MLTADDACKRPTDVDGRLVSRVSGHRRASLGRGALSLRLRAQALSRTGRGGLAAIHLPAERRAVTDVAVPVGAAQARGRRDRLACCPLSPVPCPLSPVPY